MSDVETRGNPAGGVNPGGAIAAGMLREAEAWTSVQCELLAGMGALWAEWTRRQREALEASTRSLRQMYECRNFTDLMQVQQSWIADTARRGLSDLGKLSSEAAAVTCRAAARAEAPKAREPAPAPAAAPAPRPPRATGPGGDNEAARAAAE